MHNGIASIVMGVVVFLAGTRAEEIFPGTDNSFALAVLGVIMALVGVVQISTPASAAELPHPRRR